MPARIRFGGRQPLWRVLRERGISQTQVCRDLGLNVSHLKNTAAGLTPPNDAVRALLPEYLGLPLEALFTPGALGTPFLSQFGRRPVKPR